MSSCDWQISRDIKDNLQDNKSHIRGFWVYLLLKEENKTLCGLLKVSVLSDFCVLGCQMKHWQCFRHFLTTKAIFDVDLFSFLKNIWREWIYHLRWETHQLLWFYLEVMYELSSTTLLTTDTYPIYTYMPMPISH